VLARHDLRSHEPLHDRVEHQRSGANHVDASRMHDGQRGSLRACHGKQLLGYLVDPRQTFAAYLIAYAFAVTVMLGVMGFANLVFQSMANASVQLAVDPELRGRVMGLYMLAFIGGTPIGAPVIGVLTNHFGARAGMAICGVVPLLAALVMAVAGRRAAKRDGRALREDRPRPRPAPAGNAVSASRG